MPLNGLRLRAENGAPLSTAQVDSNWSKIRNFCNALEQLFGVVLNPNGTLKDDAVGTDAILDGAVTRAKLAADALVPSGTVVAFAGLSAPDDWLECNGQQVSRTGDYAALFAAIGTTYGAGDGSTTFHLPDVQRRVIVGSGGTGSGTLANTPGSTGGSETHTLTVAQLPAHSHGLGFTVQASDNDSSGNPDLFPDGPAGQSTEETGGGEPHNNIQPSLVMMWIIKI